MMSFFAFFFTPLLEVFFLSLSEGVFSLFGGDWGEEKM
jgi:hypothetical protein